MAIPTRGALDDRENEAFEEVSGRIYKATFARLDPSQFPIPVDTSGAAVNPAFQILNAQDVVQSLTWADFNSRRLRRVTQIVYTAASVSLTASVTDSFTYTLIAGEYRLDSIQRVYTP